MSVTAPRPHVLVINDEPGLLEAMLLVLEDDFEVHTARDGHAGLAVLEQQPVHVVLLDVRLPDSDLDGTEVLRQIKMRHREMPVYMLAALDQASPATAATEHGAAAYVTKPVDADALRAMLLQATHPRACPTHMVWAAATVEAPEAVLLQSRSPAMQPVLETLQRVADTTAPVLITGETGTGKDLAARALHLASSRRRGPFIAVNCAALMDSLMESELLGHERGAFTGALRQHRGYFERAHRGTLFLDEIGSLSLARQAILLRVVQDQQLWRVGGEVFRQVDVRLLIATHTPLEVLVAQRRFRADLAYRLQVVPLPLPPLRKRLADLPLLVAHFLAKYNAAYERAVEGITQEAMHVLAAQSWPGNVRQLENLLAGCIASTTQAGVLEASTVEQELRVREMAVRGDDIRSGSAPRQWF